MLKARRNASDVPALAPQIVSKKRKFFAAQLRPISIRDRLPVAAHFPQFPTQHCRLVGHADRLQMHVRIEAGE